MDRPTERVGDEQQQVHDATDGFPVELTVEEWQKFSFEDLRQAAEKRVKEAETTLTAGTAPLPLVGDLLSSLAEELTKIAAAWKAKLAEGTIR